MIKKKKNFYNFYIILLCFVLFTLSCKNNSPSTTQPRIEEDDRDSSQRNSSSSNGSFRKVGPSFSQYKRLKSSQFDGEDCEDNEDCENQCKEINRGNSFREKCGNLPEDMVAVLFENFENLKQFNVNTLDQINPSALGTFLHMDIDVMIDLLDDSWSDRSTREFLNWAANDELVIAALKEDSKNIFLIKALKRFNSNISLALLDSIQQYRETFISQAAKVDNKEAVDLALDLIDEENEIGYFFCKREKIAQSSRKTSSCHYHSTQDSFRRNRSDYCYVHGPTVWSYINNNITLPSANFPSQLKNSTRSNLNEDSCKSFCKGHNHCEL